MIVYIATVGEWYGSSCWEEVFSSKFTAYREAWAERNRRINNDRGNGEFGRKFECPGYWVKMKPKTVRG